MASGAGEELSRYHMVVFAPFGSVVLVVAGMGGDVVLDVRLALADAFHRVLCPTYLQKG